MACCCSTSAKTCKASPILAKTAGPWAEQNWLHLKLIRAHQRSGSDSFWTSVVLTVACWSKGGREQHSTVSQCHTLRRSNSDRQLALSLSLECKSRCRLDLLAAAALESQLCACLSCLFLLLSLPTLTALCSSGPRHPTISISVSTSSPAIWLFRSDRFDSWNVTIFRSRHSASATAPTSAHLANIGAVQFLWSDRRSFPLLEPNAPRWTSNLPEAIVIPDPRRHPHPHHHISSGQHALVSCVYLQFALAVTTAESSTASALGVYPGPNNNTEISQVAFVDVYANTNTYTFYSPFFTTFTESGPQQITFRLLDDSGNVIPSYLPVTQTINFQCGTTITTSSAASSTPTGTSGSGSGGNSNGNGNSNSNSNSSTSSGSSSSTGAIAGGVVGGVIALLALGLLAFCLMRRKKKQRAQQSRLANNEADEAAFRAPNNDSTASLATAPENANTPMMRDISTKNVFADPTTSTASGAASGSSTMFSANNQAPSKFPSGSGTGGASGAAAGAAAGAGIGAAAIAARKQSREQSRAASPAGRVSESRPSTESFKDVPSSQSPPPVPSLPSSYAATNAPAAPQNASKASQPATYPTANASIESATKSPSGGGAATSTAAVGAGATAAAAAAAAKKTSSDNKEKDNKAKTSKWGFKRPSKDMGNTSKPPYTQAPYPQAVAEPAPAAAAAAAAPAAVASPSPSPPFSSPSETPASPSRSFKVIQKQPTPAAASAAGPSSASIAPSENSLNRAPALSPRSGHATPAGSIRGNNYSRAPSVASMSAGFTDAPPLPSGAASVSSMPTSEFGGNMAGVGAGRSFAASSGNSTKWHQQAYNVMPNFSHRALARSTQLDEDLIFGHLGMGLTPPPGPAGNGSESGSSKSRTDPFGDR
ncbi:hypothetical protein PHSY_001278 [Pseudozyma hubeiensis SY62]|uniref:Uncharacterized protein n=1 Tax=Pseudozyma hubeiensis (strain SY62) TaxID=1305764 RepID=R9NY78_PSEHS|nr:hypothetical protein PHSY_001278 [Pseudozyma hubeiensis SY62]GAC93713.1 hypothetical protein PHSY_001278 [Pseudozyma hubeiensis SY62]